MCLPISAAAVSRDVREIDVNNLVDILDVIRTIMYHILHYPGDHRFWRRGEDPRFASHLRPCRPRLSLGGVGSTYSGQYWYNSLSDSNWVVAPF